MESLFRVLEEIKSLDWKHLVMGAVLAVIALGSYYTYKKIQNLDFLITQQTLTEKDKFFQEFGMSTLESDLLIREILTGVRASLNATQASIWGYHNGINFGPFPFRKMSLLDESVKRGYRRLYPTHQNIPLNIYIQTTQEIWNSESYYTYSYKDSSDIDTRFILEDNSYGYMFAYPLNIENYEAPIGFFAIFLSKERAREVLPDEESLIQLEREAYAAGKRIEMIFNMQYNKLLLNGES